MDTSNKNISAMKRLTHMNQTTCNGKQTKKITTKQKQQYKHHGHG